MKHAIYVWQDRLAAESLKKLPGDSNSHYWGLGDVIRGMLSTASVCDKLGVKLCIDMRNNMFGKYFKHISHGYEVFVDQNLHNIDMIDYCYMDHIVSQHGHIYQTKTLAEHIQSNDDPVLMFTNHMIENNCYDHCIVQQVKKYFEPTTQSRDLYTKICNRFDIPKTYQVIHVRLGDASFGEFHHANLNMAYNDLWLKINNTVRSYKISPESTVLISDSIDFLKIATEMNLGYIVRPAEPVAHVGLKNKTSSLNNTLIDMLLLMNSQANFTYTVYDHQSGFALYTSMLGDTTHHRLNIK